MINSLKETFPHLESKECCQTIKDSIFEIVDDEVEKRCFIVNENGQFKVSNPMQKKIEFCAVDACLFTSANDSRADCIVYDSQTLCLIELKDCKKKNISRNRQAAKKQLIALIEFFDKNIEMGERALEAYICVTCSNQDGLYTMHHVPITLMHKLSLKSFTICNLFINVKKSLSNTIKIIF